MKTLLFILLLSVSALAQGTKPVQDAKPVDSKPVVEVSDKPEVKPAPDAIKIDDADQLRLQIAALLSERDSLRAENNDLKKQIIVLNQQSSQQQVSKLIQDLNQKYITSSKLSIDNYEFRQDPKTGNWEYGRKK